MTQTSWHWRARVVGAYIAARFRPLPKLTDRQCNICGYHGPFGPGGKGMRNDARCPRCRSVERDRLFKLWLDKEPQFLDQKDILHFAPERSLTSLVRPLARRYRSADIVPGRADLVLNIEQLELTSASVEVVICAHVLEHVDDAKALGELFRILVPGGLAVISVPIVAGWSASYENPAIVTAKERAVHFGQWDHVRCYGADLRDRIRVAGFSLREFSASPSEGVSHGLIRGDTLFIAQKPG